MVLAGVYTQQGHWLVMFTYNGGTGWWYLHTTVALACWLVVPTYSSSTGWLAGGAYTQRWWCLHTTVVVPTHNGGGAYTQRWWCLAGGAYYLGTTYNGGTC